MKGLNTIRSQFDERIMNMAKLSPFRTTRWTFKMRLVSCAILIQYINGFSASTSRKTIQQGRSKPTFSPFVRYPSHLDHRGLKSLFLINNDSSPGMTQDKIKANDNDNMGSSYDDLLEQARRLKVQAEKTRLEAEMMDMKLSMEKISSLERRLESEFLDLDEMELINSQLGVLNKKLGRSSSSALPVEVTRKESESLPSSQTMTNNTTTINSNNINEHTTTNDTLSQLAPPTSSGSGTPLTPAQITESIANFSALPTPIQSLIAESVSLPPDANASTVIDALSSAGRLYQDDNGIEMFEIDEATIDEFFDSEYLETSAYVAALLPESTRRWDQALDEESVRVFREEVLGEGGVKGVWVPYGRGREKDGQEVPGGFLIRGERPFEERPISDGDGSSFEDKSRSREDDYNGDHLVRVLDDRLSRSSIADKVQFFYLRDPTPYTEEDFESGREMDAPVIFVTGRDVSQGNDSQWLLTATTVCGVGTLAALSALAFVPVPGGSVGIENKALMVMDWNKWGMLGELFSLTKGGATAAVVGENVGMLFLGICGIQLLHELGHAVIARRDKFNISLPTIIPSFSIGWQGCYTPLLTPAKNLQSLFDFAVAGPLTGILASIAALSVGLQLTISMPLQQAVTIFPKLPTDFLRLSSLAGGIVDAVLGGVGGFTTPGGDMTELIALHPLAVAGYIGIIVNALALLPIGSTDGGRISLTLFGRSLSRLVQGFTLFLLIVVAPLGGYDDYGILMTYGLFAFFTQRELEIPCRNEVDDLEFARVLTAIAVGMVTVLALVPIK